MRHNNNKRNMFDSRWVLKMDTIRYSASRQINFLWACSRMEKRILNRIEQNKTHCQYLDNQKEIRQQICEVYKMLQSSNGRLLSNNHQLNFMKYTSTKLSESWIISFIYWEVFDTFVITTVPCP
jgi:hypothetical protein